ncbi:MAG: hypothetical protein AVDCRST_MAG35-2452 [uncultured Quadrisphaera sp.]|uniref:Uncharacterized protein n=1 Tax=uncultured Quadrisphaera sp. TaxID=904978 RepID=A0A6J4PXV3_9ACTN|nr:MAG: hypothetical protein AVDCRST_MAG35-2452 [uncultured Quadrisphaera sp.]
MARVLARVPDEGWTSANLSRARAASLAPERSSFGCGAGSSW